MQKKHAVASGSTLILLYSLGPSREFLPLKQNSYSLTEFQGFELTINTQQFFKSSNITYTRI